LNLGGLSNLLKQQFPDTDIPEPILDLSVGSFSDWDSLNHISLLLSIEEHYDIRFSLDEMTELTSIRNIVLALESRGIDP